MLTYVLFYIFMKKDKLYFLTFLSIAIIFLFIASLSIKYFVNVSANQLIELQLESSQRESEEIASLVNFELEQNILKTEVVTHVQSMLQQKKEDILFVSLFDWSGKSVCHPDITKVGRKVNSTQSLLNSLKDENRSEELYELLMSQDEGSADKMSEIIHISPVKNSDLIVAAHIDLEKLGLEIRKLKKSFYIIFILMGILIILSSFIAVRIIGSYYEKQLEQKNSNLESELINLSKLNTDLLNYQQKVISKDAVDEESETTSLETGKKRILTHVRNELVPIHIDEIAFIYTENTITFVVTSDAKKSTTNTSLDDLYTTLDRALFFRANRQFIISITSINKIIKYGNSQLKILMHDTDVEILISKNKAAEFRQWLNF